MSKELLSETARLMGSVSSRRKRQAARENGKKGGRPKGSKDSKPRTRSKGKRSGEHYEPIED